MTERAEGKTPQRGQCGKDVQRMPQMVSAGNQEFAFEGNKVLIG